MRSIRRDADDVRSARGGDEERDLSQVLGEPSVFLHFVFIFRHTRVGRYRQAFVFFGANIGERNNWHQLHDIWLCKIIMP